MAAVILLADDEPEDLKKYSAALGDAGYVVKEARSIAQARELLENEKLDLAVIDLHLRGGGPDDNSGVLLAEEFGDERRPIIIYTNLLTVDGVQLALKQRENGRPPAVDVVKKLDGPAKLLDTVRRFLRPKVFVAHGHDHAARDEVTALLAENKVQAIVLQEESGAGQVLIEKFERNANVEFAIVLVTPDDEGRLKMEAGPETRLRPRARQNVIFELGYFLGKVGRRRVAALYYEGRQKLELPSNYHGVEMIKKDRDGKWKKELMETMLQAGIRKGR